MRACAPYRELLVHTHVRDAERPPHHRMCAWGGPPVVKINNQQVFLSCWKPTETQLESWRMNKLMFKAARQVKDVMF